MGCNADRNPHTDDLDACVVTATHTQQHATTLDVTLNGEVIHTTDEHPFAVVDGDTVRWVQAQDLRVGDAVLAANGTTGTVEAIAVIHEPQTMVNLTVDVVATFAVGDGAWVVHNTDDYCLLLGPSGMFSEMNNILESRPHLRLVVVEGNSDVANLLKFGATNWPNRNRLEILNTRFGQPNTLSTSKIAMGGGKQAVELYSILPGPAGGGTVKQTIEQIQRTAATHLAPGGRMYIVSETTHPAEVFGGLVEWNLVRNDIQWDLIEQGRNGPLIPFPKQNDAPILRTDGSVLSTPNNTITFMRGLVNDYWGIKTGG